VVENKKVDKGERALVEKNVGMDDSEVGDTALGIGRVEPVTVVAKGKRGAGVAFVEVATKTKTESDGAAVAAGLDLDIEEVADMEEVVVEAEETEVRVVVVVEAVKVFKAARTIPLKSTPEIVPEGGVVPVFDVEVPDVDQTLGVEAGDGAENGAVEERAVGAFQMGSQVGFLYVCVLVIHVWFMKNDNNLPFWRTAWPRRQAYMCSEGWW
jgi:hypothetical protein